MVKVIRPDGLVLYDDYVDLRGDETHKNIEKVHGPNAVIKLADGTDWVVKQCPLCKCNKSYDPDEPNNCLEGCDGECPCHDGLPDEERYRVNFK